MKKLYQINKWSVITTTALYLTFWGGILAEIVLGLIQIIISLYIIYRFHKLNRKIMTLFVIYIIATIGSVTFFSAINFKHIFMWVIVSMSLAFFHLYITFKIHKSWIHN